MVALHNNISKIDKICSYFGYLNDIKIGIIDKSLIMFCGESCLIPEKKLNDIILINLESNETKRFKLDIKKRMAHSSCVISDVLYSFGGKGKHKN
jgi:hypothetical protein